MKTGPVRRAAGAVGLLALVPTSGMLIAGNITPQVAAVRAAITLLSVLILARVATWGVGWIADAAQRRPARDPSPEPAVAAAPPAGSPPAAGGVAPR